MNGVAVLVANGLHFKVPGVLQELLNVHAAVTKGSRRFLPGCFNSGAQFSFIAGNTHAASTATGARFHNYWVLNLSSHFDCFFNIFNGVFGAREYWRASLASEALAVDLVAKRIHCFWTWTDEFKAGRSAYFCKVRVLTEESVARMNRFRMAHFSRCDDALNLQVRLFGRARSDADGSVCLLKPGTALVC